MKNKIKALKYRKLKKLIHPLLLKALSSKTTGDLEVIGKFPKDGNYLIVGNHLCIEDIPTLAEAIHEHFYLLVSDEDKGTLDGLGLEANGVQWVHRTDKASRVESAKNTVEILKKGNNFAMYPEATWNLSPNMLILPMNYGCIRIALDSNVPIIPVVSCFTETGRKTIIGEVFVPTENLAESVNELRDRMASMVYNQIQLDYKNSSSPDVYVKQIDGEDYYYEKRENIDKNYWNEYNSKKYDAYERAKQDKNGVRNFESQFIFTPKSDSYSYFQVFNSNIKKSENGKMIINRISSEKNGISLLNDAKEFFEYGYNEDVLVRELKK